MSDLFGLGLPILFGFVMPMEEASLSLNNNTACIPIKRHLYYVYILTNQATTVLYTGVTNNLARRLIEHWMSRGDSKTFAGRYNCYNLIYFEEFQYILNAIAREKQIKGWRKEKKLELIRTKNPDWVFLNAQFCGEWPLKDPPMRY